MFKHYIMNQVILPIYLAVKLPKKDIAFVRQTGCPAYHPRMMMKIILCAYTISVFREKN